MSIFQNKSVRYWCLRLCAGVCAAALLLAFSAKQGAAQVEFEESASKIAVSIDGKLFTELQKGEAAHKPYLSPIFSASGKRITRGFPDETIPGDPTDHPHQRGIWMGYEHLSGMNLWELDPADPHPHMGVLRFDKVLEMHEGENSGTLVAAVSWLDQDGKPVIEQTLTLTFYAHTGERRLFDVEMQLKALKEVTFEDERDGIFGIRLNPAFDEAKGGKLVNAEGVADAKPIEGKHSAWVDWQTVMDGETLGVTLMDSPKNHRAPTTWVTRPGCLLFANPFAQRYYDRTREDGAMSLQKGDELHLRYRVFIHPAGSDVAAAYKEFAAQ